MVKKPIAKACDPDVAELERRLIPTCCKESLDGRARSAGGLWKPLSVPWVNDQLQRQQ